jgi:hypothetical protein
MRKKSILGFIIITLLFISCQKKERDMEFVKQEMTEMGYDGTFREPTGTLEKTAINLVGIDEMLIYESQGNHIVVLQFRSTNEDEIRNRIESVITFVEPYLSPEDMDNINNHKELLDRNSIIHNNMMLVWQTERPEDLVKLIENNF